MDIESVVIETNMTATAILFLKSKEQMPEEVKVNFFAVAKGAFEYDSRDSRSGNILTSTYVYSSGLEDLELDLQDYHNFRWADKNGVFFTSVPAISKKFNSETNELELYPTKIIAFNLNESKQDVIRKCEENGFSATALEIQKFLESYRIDATLVMQRPKRPKGFFASIFG